jgi:hypothetical protein
MQEKMRALAKLVEEEVSNSAGAGLALGNVLWLNKKAKELEVSRSHAKSCPGGSRP